MMKRNAWRGTGTKVWLGLLLAVSLTACKPGDDNGENKPLSRADVGVTVALPAVDGRPVRPAGTSHGELTRTPPIAPGPKDWFVDVTERSGIKFVHQFCDDRIANIVESNGAGAVILDFDRDGWMDVYLCNCGPLEGVTRHAPGTQREPNRLYRNLGNGTFEDVTPKAGVGGNRYCMAAAAGDYDNDGWTDLYLVNVGNNQLLRNRGNGTFEDVSAKAGVGDPGTGIGAVFTDVDRDGHLDLFVANYLSYDPNYKLYFNPDAYPGPLSYKSEFNVLYRNRGDATFEDVSEPAGVRVDNHRGMSACAFDFDGDGDEDIYVCNDATPNLMLVNDGRGRFQERGLQLGVAFNANGEAAGSMTATIGDCNGDLLPDILVSRLGYGSLYVGTANQVFEDRMITSGVGSFTAQYVGWGSNFIDYDRDGDLDIFVANGDAHHLVGWESLLLENQGAGNYTDARDTAGTYFDAKIRARGSVVLDFDNDGRQDLLVTAMGDRVFLLRNQTPQNHAWIALALEGTQSNRDGFGATLRLTAGGKTYAALARCPAAFLGQSDPRVYFGLGNAKTIEKLEIRWPSGKLQTLENLSPNRILKIKES